MFFVSRPRVIRRFALSCLLALCPTLSASRALAQGAAYDLAGPSLQVTVTRNGARLLIADVPNLRPGDRLSVAADLPRDQSARYLLVLAFLRGATNPPPEKWTVVAETWKAKRGSIEAEIPAGAEQVLVFLVPDTGGASGAVRSAVHGRPGAFVRASQELNQAMLDRARLDAFLEAIRRQGEANPERLAGISPQLSRSLAVKYEGDCLIRPPELQAACLTQASNAVVLADAQTSSIAETLAGAPTDLALQLSATPQGGYGYYSPYIGVVRDLARIFGAFQTAQLQFIPALNVIRRDRIALMLNAVPSFKKPQSVLVAALPPVGPARLPPLQSAADASLCAGRPGLVLPVTGAPLIYATSYAREMRLRVGATDLPVTSDAERGGFVVADNALLAGLNGTVEGQIHGFWGFEPFDGPRFRLAGQGVRAWQAVAGASLVVGRDTPLLLTGGAAACVAGVGMERDGATRPVKWDTVNGDVLSLKVPLGDVSPGPITLVVRSHGAVEPQRLTLRAYSEASRITGFTLHAGDRNGILTGSRLDQVAGLDIGGITFRPGALERAGETDRLPMTTDMAEVGALSPGQSRNATVLLTDGRRVPVKATVAPARPGASIETMTVDRTAVSARLPITIEGAGLVPQDAPLTFSLKAAGSARFAAGDRVEVVADGAAPVGADLRLQDPMVAIARLTPGEALGPSAYGPLRFRVVQGEVAGDWQPLAVLVRLPALTGLDCGGMAPTCRLTGTGLFLLGAVASGGQQLAVPDGFTGSTLDVPRPREGRLRLVLRDTPEAAAYVTVPN